MAYRPAGFQMTKWKITGDLVFCVKRRGKAITCDIPPGPPEVPPEWAAAAADKESVGEHLIHSSVKAKSHLFWKRHFLATAATTGKMADIFLNDSVVKFNVCKWCLDVECVNSSVVSGDHNQCPAAGLWGITLTASAEQTGQIKPIRRDCSTVNN